MANNPTRALEFASDNWTAVATRSPKATAPTVFSVLNTVHERESFYSEKDNELFSLLK